MKYPLLSICIPTYNRSYLLEPMLEKLTPICNKLSIPVYISDNCSTDNTQEIIKRFSDKCEIYNIRQETNIGPDANFEYLIRNAQSKYKWLLSDSIVIHEDQTRSLIERLSKNEDYDFVVVGVRIRTNAYPDETIYTDANELLKDIGWHMTTNQSLIYSDKVVSDLQFRRFYNSNFLQTGIIFEYIAGRNFSCLFYNVVKSDGLGLQKKGDWSGETLEYFCKRWFLFVMSLPVSYKIENKLTCIMAHGVKSSLFSKKNLVYLREKKILTLKKLIKYKEYLKYTMEYRRFAFAICVVPAWFISVSIKIAKKIYHATR